MLFQSWRRVCAALILCGGMCAVALGDGKGFTAVAQQHTQTDGDDSSIIFFRLQDDIDADGIPGSIPTIVLAPDGQGGFVSNFAVIHDFDDLHTFNVSFDTVSVANLPNSGAIDVA